jgi:hypothetical protein
MGGSNRRKKLGLAVLCAGLICGLVPAAAQQQDDQTSRLRAALREATAHARDLEDQNATLQAKQSEADRDKLALTDKLAADEKELAGLRQHEAADQGALHQSSAQLEAEQANLAKWQGAYKDAAEKAVTRDSDAKRLDAALSQTRHRAETCEAKNQDLYKLGQQVLDLYDQKGLFDLLAAGEPVTKLKRVEYENIMQDYQDKLRGDEIQQSGP